VCVRVCVAGLAAESRFSVTCVHVCVSVCAREKECVDVFAAKSHGACVTCVCATVCVRVCVYMCVCVGVWESERESACVAVFAEES